MMLPVHERFIKQAKKKISRDNRLTGLLAGGSMIHGAMDEYSDLDLVIVCDNVYRNEIMEQRIQLAEELGQLLSAFTGEHVGEPRLVICLYGPPLLHVDLKFIRNQSLGYEQRIRLCFGRETRRSERSLPRHPLPIHRPLCNEWRIGSGFGCITVRRN